MDGKFDVFDEYGQYVGRIAPSGQGALDSCFMLLAVILLWMFGFLIYALIRLLIEGFKALGKGEIGKAVRYLIIPAVLLFVGVILLLSNASSAAARQDQEKAAQQEANQAEQATHSRLEGNLKLVIVSPISYETCYTDPNIPLCPGSKQTYTDENGWIVTQFAILTVQNNSPITVWVDIFGEGGSDEAYDWTSCWKHSSYNSLPPGEAFSVWCRDRSYRGGMKGSRPTPSTKLCVSLEADYDTGLGSLEMPEIKVCQPVSFQ
jgi:hypothetical protein